LEVEYQVEKGRTHVTEENIVKVLVKGREALA
jgi:hypothetical protein